MPFESEAWKENRELSFRYDMSWDLVHGGILNGKSAEEVEDLLGEPMYADVFETTAMPMFTPEDGFGPGDEYWYYGLGGEKHECGIGPSGAVLAVKLRGGKVVAVRKVVH